MVLTVVLSNMISFCFVVVITWGVEGGRVGGFCGLLIVFFSGISEFRRILILY